MSSEEIDSSRERAEAFASAALAGSGGEFRLQRLAELFRETDAPGAIEVYRAWHGAEEMTTEEMVAAASKTRVTHFDPAEDPVPSDSKIRIKQAYEQALEAGLESEASFLRGVKAERATPVRRSPPEEVSG